MTVEEAVAFAEQWVNDWNSHDVEAVLRHFADDVTFTSPLATRLFPDSGGVVGGKERPRHLPGQPRLGSHGRDGESHRPFLEIKGVSSSRTYTGSTRLPHLSSDG